jgi:hypothetical protein
MYGFQAYFHGPAVKDNPDCVKLNTVLTRIEVSSPSLIAARHRLLTRRVCLLFFNILSIISGPGKEILTHIVTTDFSPVLS